MGARLGRRDCPQTRRVRSPLGAVTMVPPGGWSLVENKRNTYHRLINGHTHQTISHEFQRVTAMMNVDVGKGGGWWRRAGAGGGSGVPAGRRRSGLLFAPFGGRFHDRGAGVLCFVLARAPHAVGRGTVRCRADARRRWGGDVRWSGSGCRGWRALGCARCLRGRGGGAAASGPT